MSPPDPDSEGSPAEPTGVTATSQGTSRAAFRQIGERERYSGERLRVVVGTFVGPDGFTFEREIVRTFDAVCIVALESDREHVLLVRQYRGPVDRALLELPAGKLDIVGEPPELCAARELAEEVGTEAERFTELGRFFISPGYSDELTICFLAEELKRGTRAADGIEEEHLVVERISLGSVEELIATGEIADAKTIAGLLLARSVLKTAPTGPKTSG
jgi:ADP-ribose pyrophosphatase